MPELKFPSFPNAAAIRAIERRGHKFLPSGDWYTVWQKAHQTAFTVAQSAGFDILTDIYGAMHRAMDSGTTFEQFRRELEPVLIRKGWRGRDEKTGKQLGAPWRLKTIFQTNLRVSAAQGEWASIQRTKELRPYLWYNAILDKRTRPLHASWDNLVLPVDDPWWQTHFPPNGWNCRCKALSLDEDDIRAYGLIIADKAPDDGSRIWINPATGEEIEVPNGIDPGWNYNPGAVDQAAHSAKLAMDKLADMPPEMGAQAITKLALSFPQVEQELKGWIAGVTTAIANGIFRPTKTRRVVGALPDKVIENTKKHSIDLETGAISISDDDIMHALRTTKKDKWPIDIFNTLPTLLLDPEEIYWDKKENDIIYIINIGDSKGKLVIQINKELEVREHKSGKRKKYLRRVNNVRTAKIVSNINDFYNKGTYEKIK